MFFVDISLPCSVVLVFAMLLFSPSFWPPFSTIVLSIKFHIYFRFDQKGIDDGIEEDSKLEN